MIRTIWLAAFCLAGLGGLCASKVTASIYPSEECAPEQVQVQPVLSDAIVQDTLTKGDKAEVTEAPAADATSSLPIESNDVSAGKPPDESRPLITPSKKVGGVEGTLPIRCSPVSRLTPITSVKVPPMSVPTTQTRLPLMLFFPR